MNAFDRFTGLLAAILDAIRLLFEKATPSAKAMLAAVLPYATPIPVAMLTAAKAEQFLGLTSTSAGILVFSLEGIGIWTTSNFVESLIDLIRSRNGKTILMTLFYAVMVAVYIAILVNLNVSLETAMGEVNPVLSRVITLICFLPLLAGFSNGFQGYKLEAKEAISTQKALEEQHYQEKRADRKELQRLKLGLTAPAAPQLPAPASKEKHAGDYKDFVMELLDQNQGNLALTDITKLVNKTKRVDFVHKDVKGTWHKFTQEWKRQHGIQ